MRTVLMAAVVVLMTAASAQAQNPCTVTDTATFYLNPDRIYLAAPNHNANEVDGGPLYNEYEYALFAEGADPNTATPVQGPSTMPKSAFTLQSGTTDCYRADVPSSIPTSQRLIGAFRSKRNARPGLPLATSAWTVTDVPFGVAPAALPALGPTRWVSGQ